MNLEELRVKGGVGVGVREDLVLLHASNLWVVTEDNRLSIGSEARTRVQDETKRVSGVVTFPQI